jgi:hypothetical protein
MVEVVGDGDVGWPAEFTAVAGYPLKVWRLPL